jgi:hypothetical protein
LAEGDGAGEQPGVAVSRDSSVVIGSPLQYVGPYRPADIQEAAAHRFFIQTRIGAVVATVVSFSVMALVILVMILAIDGRSVEYIKGVVESLQPYVLPGFGVLVGYGLGRKPE